MAFKTQIWKCGAFLFGIFIGFSMLMLIILVSVIIERSLKHGSSLSEFYLDSNDGNTSTNIAEDTYPAIPDIDVAFPFDFTDLEIPQDFDMVHRGFFKRRFQKYKFYAWKLRSKRPLKKFQPRVFCFVFVKEKQIALEIIKSWGQRCGTLFMYTSTRSTDTFEEEVHDELEKSGNIRSILHWQLVIGVFKEINLHRGDSEWFIKIDQNSFLIMENLHVLLKSYDFSHPLIFGHLQKFRRDYISLRNGCLMSKEAIKRIGDNDLKKNRPVPDPADFYFSYDLEFDKYINFLEIRKVDSRDNLGRLLFLPLQLTQSFYSLPQDSIVPNDPGIDEKIREYILKISSKPIKEGFDCCSDQAIVLPKDQLIGLEYMLYRVIAYGIRQNYSNPERDK